MHTVVDIIPLFLHVSLLFFFGGLIAFLLPVNCVLVYLMAVVLVVFTGIYVYFTVLPMISFDSPFHTPLSKFTWFLWQWYSNLSKPDDHSILSLAECEGPIIDKSPTFHTLDLTPIYYFGITCFVFDYVISSFLPLQHTPQPWKQDLPTSSTARRLLYVQWLGPSYSPVLRDYQSLFVAHSRPFLIIFFLFTPKSQPILDNPPGS